MSDFITMQCPSCGGKLAVGNNVLSLKCEHCGVEHMIRREAGEVTLESYARCPVCNRNDKAEKVTAILRSQTHSTQGIAYQTLTTTAKTGSESASANQQVAIPIQTSQMSELAKYLTPPPQPEPDRTVIIQEKTSHLALITAIMTGIIGVAFSLCTLVVLAGYLSGMSTDTESILAGTVGILTCGLLSLAPVGLSVFLFFFSVPCENRKNQEKKVLYENKRREQQLQSDEKINHWNTAMERWNLLYYCSRDDCVFLPGTHTHAPVVNMVEYIYRP
jgi:predicted RNA-binding Zn-ribbon protein involved in translation (DUF1610 family)